MKIFSLDTGRFKLDGGAMFGVVPKTLWQSRNPADENNLCDWAMRCLLIDTGNELVVIDSGMGDKQDDKFKSYYEPRLISIEDCIKQAGYSPADVTHHLLTHLHFDHCGGSIVKEQDGFLQPAFPNAEYIVSKAQWNEAANPNAREKASFLKENIRPMKDAKSFRLVDGPGQILPGLRVEFSYGHTEGMMIPIIETGGETILYGADLFPSHWHIPLPWVMAYDMQPKITLQEKIEVLKKAADGNWRIFYEHDPNVELGSLQTTDRGIKHGESTTLKSFLQ